VGGGVRLLDRRHDVRPLADGRIEDLEHHLAPVRRGGLIRRRGTPEAVAGPDLVLLGDDHPGRELGRGHFAIPIDSIDFMMAASDALLSSSGTKPRPTMPLPLGVTPATTRSGPFLGPRTPASSSCQRSREITPRDFLSSGLLHVTLRFNGFSPACLHSSTIAASLVAFAFFASLTSTSTPRNTMTGPDSDAWATVALD